jgi:hypothetical protein
MGRYVPRLFLDYFAAGVARTFAYELLDEGTARDEIEQNFGLLRHDGSPKPAFVALRCLLATLADPGPPFRPAPIRYRLDGGAPALRRAHFRKRDGRAYIVLWLDAPSYDERRGDLVVAPRRVTLRFDEPPREARVLLPLAAGRELARVPRPRALTVEVPDHPLVVELRPPS